MGPIVNKIDQYLKTEGLSEETILVLENLKKVFTDESIAAEMLTILSTNFRGDGYGQSKKDKEEGATITKANFFDRMVVAAEFPTGTAASRHSHNPH